MIRTTTHHFHRFANPAKLRAYKEFRATAINILKWYVDYLWNTRIAWGSQVLDVSAGHYHTPSFISTTAVQCPLPGSARLHKCLSTQACGIVKAVLTKHRRSPTKPQIHDAVNLELNSPNIDVTESKEFDFWLRLKCLGIPEILLPLKHHRHSLKYTVKGKRLNSFLLGPNYVDVRWELTAPKTRKRKVVGADQGLKTVLSLSDGNTSDIHHHPHGWTLDSILSRMSKQRKGSKGFRRTQDLRANFINWSINRMSLDQYKTIKLEDVKCLRYGHSTSRKLSHWTYTLIKQKVERLCELSGVQITYNSSAYRSQRCSRCGLVKKSNRNGKDYTCICGYTADADINAAINHSLDLPPIPKDFLNRRLNLKGFFWNSEGIRLPEQA